MYLRLARGKNRTCQQVYVSGKLVDIDAEGHLMADVSMQDAADFLETGEWVEDTEPRRAEIVAAVVAKAKHTVEDCYREVTAALQRSPEMVERLRYFLAGFPGGAEKKKNPPVAAASVSPADASPSDSTPDEEGEDLALVPAMEAEGTDDLSEHEPSEPVDEKALKLAQAHEANQGTKNAVIERLKAAGLKYDPALRKAQLVAILFGLPDGWEV